MLLTQTIYNEKKSWNGGRKQRGFHAQLFRRGKTHYIVMFAENQTWRSEFIPIFFVAGYIQTFIKMPTEIIIKRIITIANHILNVIS